MSKKKPIKPREGAAPVANRPLVSTTPSLNNKQRLDAQAVRREELMAHPKASRFVDTIMSRALGETDEAPAVVNSAQTLVANHLLGKHGDEAASLQKPTDTAITFNIGGTPYDPIAKESLPLPAEEAALSLEDRVMRLAGVTIDQPEGT